jgi:CheY-like chemotaxis protein
VTVLVVEDNASLRRIVTRQLNALGYKVKEAGDAASALAVLAEGPVDLLFSDIVMPGGMNGFELAERAGGLQPGLKVVLTSGYPQQLGHANAAAPSGTHRLLQKPYRKQEIARVLRETLES